MTKVSVIIPNYNHAPFLQQRIESILNQTYQDFELIVLDDCSTDNSREILETLKNHPKVSHLIFNEVNSGSTFKQWQKGIELAKGEFIWIAESDDWCEPSLLAELINPMINDHNIVLSFCQSILISESQAILGLTQSKQLANLTTGNKFIKSRLFNRNEIANASMVVFKRSAIPTFSSDFTNMKYCGDWYLWVNICLNGSVFESGKYLNYFVRHNNSTITNASRNGLDFIEGNKIFKFIENQIEVSQVEKNANINLRIELFEFLKPHFLNEDVLKAAYDSMIELDSIVYPILATTTKSKSKPLQFLSFLKKLTRLQ
ncbi:MAG TPA: glycosyltransferase family 2 protein [Hanamia sp.]|nr:glycosyltransferase family 2 protein [Hanamia sp.]